MENLELKIAEMEETIRTLQQCVAAFKIDKQLMIKREKLIKAGIATKVVYNADGLIVDVQELLSSDIPTLPISKIDGLSEELNRKIGIDQLSSINTRIDQILEPGNTVKTGTKVNIDAKGRVTNVSDLLPSDIPTLPISHIEGLSDKLDEISSSSVTQFQEEYKTEPGIGCKLEYDNMGRIVKSHPLTIEDLPIDLINKLNEIDSTLLTRVDTNTINDLYGLINSIPAQQRIPSGTYVKLDIDENGNASSTPLSPSDIPTLPIDKIDKLIELLSSKAEHSSLMELQNTVSTILSRMKTINELNQLSRTVENNSERTQVETLKRDIDDIRESISRVSVDQPVMDELQKLNSRISELSSRVAQLELKNKI